ncbi:hypothetical protein [Alysiella filiformis]|uniref:DUF2690 domain-containing protein n=1 Tax=Alysiella filiformis DSM 16848 TaxID=1120981 RepID=A0A286EAM5_9NEIS|nr:hypothetical protein [Alysiella filiformis]QMT32286.1 hypothetical protein H3L97_05500 [Alysiella filiformis]UBQ56795.1 hypothetical protein JF568_03190 [Alysiella filiformis DSM 16848]SOD67948.1 hypothetical protein SAMN02746062_01063 [Alysiella filiformis DSM 16848]
MKMKFFHLCGMSIALSGLLLSNTALANPEPHCPAKAISKTFFRNNQGKTVGEVQLYWSEKCGKNWAKVISYDAKNYPVGAAWLENAKNDGERVKFHTLKEDTGSSNGTYYANEMYSQSIYGRNLTVRAAGTLVPQGRDTYAYNGHMVQKTQAY